MRSVINSHDQMWTGIRLLAAHPCVTDLLVFGTLKWVMQAGLLIVPGLHYFVI